MTNVLANHFHLGEFIFILGVSGLIWTLSSIPVVMAIAEAHSIYQDKVLLSVAIIIEPPHGKTNILHMRKKRRRSASR